MTQKLFILLAIAASFGFGFALKSVISNKVENDTEINKVTGIGGIFFKCKDPNIMTEWYKENLGLDTDKYGGTTFEWYEGADSTKKAQTQWQPFPESTKYFGPPSQDYMINYRVDNLEAILVELKKNDVTIIDTIETGDYGKFLHILDAEGNKLELWEPTK